MFVLWFGASCGNRVDVEIERVEIRSIEEFEARDPAFLLGFAEGGASQLRFSVDMAPELEPAAELSVVREQRPGSVRR